VRLLDQRATREMDWAESGGRPSHWDEAWVWSHLDRPPTWVASNIFQGYATFRGSGDRWALVRVWLRPSSRRGGLLTGAWPAWRERYGEFTVVLPSEPMQAFLRRAGYVPGPRFAGERSSHWLPRSLAPR
jgi:hypothetical protein